MSAIASFHLVTERRGRQPLALARLGLDRPRLRRVDGLTFVRTLGTGRDSNTGPSIDARRTAVFAVWRDESDLDRFLETHQIARRWGRAHEAWHVRLLAVSARGSWGGLVADDVPRTDDAIDSSGPVVVLTRATVRPGATLGFLRASRATATAAARAAGNLGVVGVGERPIGRLGTVSVWATSHDARRFATEHDGHQAAMTAALDQHWFHEELFATFVPMASQGRWNGRDPLR